MLRLNVASASVVTVRALMDKGLVVAPQPDTALYSLVSGSMGVFNGGMLFEGPATSEALQFAAEMLVGNSNRFDEKIQTCSDHDIARDQARVGIASLIRRNIHITRNQAQPMVRSILEHVSKTLAEVSDVGVMTPIITDKLHKLYDNRYYNELVTVNAAEAVYGDFPHIDTLPVLDLSGIRSLALTGIDSVDEEVIDLIDNIGADRFVTAYTQSFTKSERIKDVGALDRDQLLIALLIARSIRANRRATELGTTMSTEVLTRFISQAALRIQGKVDQFRDFYDQNMMVIKYPETVRLNASGAESSILVHDDLYTEWLEAGGSPEIIYGAMFTDRARDSEVLLNDKERYVAACEKYLTSVSSANEANRDKFIKVAIFESFLENLKTQDPVEGIEVNRDNLNYQLREILNGLTSVELNDTANLVTGLVCDLLFPNTYSKHIIQQMTRYQQERPNADPNDLSTMATLDIVIKWVVRCMKLIKV